MLGDKVAEVSGRITGRRVLENPNGGPKVEASFETQGKLLGVDVKEIGTYWSVLRADGILYGEGNGVVMGQNGEAATWIGQGVGTIEKDGSVGYRGALYYQTSSANWSRLNGIAAVFEHDVDAQGNARSVLWEWK